MSISKVYSAQTNFLDAQIIDIEVDLSKGLHSFSIVGLAGKAVDESKDRVSASIKNSGFKSPKNKNQKIVVSLAPADIKKEGPIFDLPIAIAYLIASGDIKASTEKRLFIGELALDGKLRPIKGALPITRRASLSGFEEIFLPKENADEASTVDGIKVFGAEKLSDILGHINQKSDEDNIIPKVMLSPHLKKLDEITENEIDIDFSDIKGQESAKRGLEIAAAGGHNIIMFGPPGTGKTMLAKAFTHLLPPLSFDEMIEVSSIYSIGGHLEGNLMKHPPFRSPHHTASYVSLVGGGSTLKPGEITMAHKGVLFLDEFPEFDLKVLETLRQPLEDKVITVSRAKGSVKYPADFILIATMNPCPCGNFGIKGKDCICSPIQIEKYRKKLSGPIVDRIDMWVEVSSIDHSKLIDKTEGESQTKLIKEKIVLARKKQAERAKIFNLKGNTNSLITSKDIVNHIKISANVKNILDESAKNLDLSARVYHRLIKLARTIADLDFSDEIKENHILEAIQYRPKRTN